MNYSKQKDNFMKDAYSQILKKFYESSAVTQQADYKSQIERYRKKSRLKSSGFFYNALTDDNLLSLQKDRSRPVVGYFCNLIPEEIILAFGALPVRLCSQDSVCSQIGEEIIPGDICPMIKSAYGALRNNKFKHIDLLVVPAACDGKMKLTELFTPFKEVYFLDLPKDSDYLENADIWTKKYNQFYEFLKQRYRRKITRRELLKACEILNKRTLTFRKIYHLRAENPKVINSFDYFAMSYASFFIDPLTWIENANKMYEEAKEIKDKKSSIFNGKRLLLAGAPIIFPNFKILEIVDEIGCEICADTLCCAYGRMYNPVEIDEETEDGIIRALCLKYIAATTCPCFLGIDKLIDHIIDTVKKYNLDGVIYHNLRLCQVYEMQTVLLRQILKEDKIPFLSIKTDLGREDTAQIKTRMEAYLEMMR